MKTSLIVLVVLVTISDSSPSPYGPPGIVERPHVNTEIKFPPSVDEKDNINEESPDPNTNQCPKIDDYESSICHTFFEKESADINEESPDPNIYQCPTPDVYFRIMCMNILTSKAADINEESTDFIHNHCLAFVEQFDDLCRHIFKKEAAVPDIYRESPDFGGPNRFSSHGKVAASPSLKYTGPDYFDGEPAQPFNPLDHLPTLG